MTHIPRRPGPRLPLLSATVAAIIGGQHVPMRPVRLCNKRGCEAIATWTAGAKVWAIGAPKRDDNYITLQFGIELCDKCKGETKVSSLITDAGWRQIVKAIHYERRARPDRASIELFFTPLN